MTDERLLGELATEPAETETPVTEVSIVAAASPDVVVNGTPDRRPDHDAIDRLARSLLPELVARLSVTGLGEIEIRQDDWKVRVRRPAAPARRGSDGVAAGRRASGPGILSRSQPGHAGHGHPRGAVERQDGASPASPDAAMSDGAEGARGSRSVIVTSPAVGVYHPGKQSIGTRVQSGDRIGAVDMLGVPQEVVASVDGVLGESLVEPGEAVEYGQDLIRIEPVEVPG